MASDLRSRFTATVVAGVTEPAPPRSSRLRRGRLDLVFAADVLIAVVCWGITWGLLVTQNSHHSPHNKGLLFLLSVVLSAPVVLRTHFPLAAWSTAALAMFWAGVVLRPSWSGGLWAAAVVYMLCLYAVTVRCKPWVVTSAALVTVIGAATVESQRVTSALVITLVPVLTGSSSGPGGATSSNWRWPNAATRASGYCSRSASGSPANCTTSSPTTCR